MDRLTARRKEGLAYFPECFKEPCLGCGCAKENCEFMSKVCEKLANYEETEGQDWILVTKKMPEENDSIFAKLKGTAEWKPGMFEKISKNVLTTVKYDDGTLLSKQAHTIDGKWKTELSCLGGTVIAWKPYPDPYKENTKC